MGELIAIKVLTTLTKDYGLPENIKITWNKSDAEQVSRAEKVFQKYLHEGWMAFSEDDGVRKQIFKFDSGSVRIMLIPPLGGG